MNSEIVATLEAAYPPPRPPSDTLELPVMSLEDLVKLRDDVAKAVEQIKRRIDGAEHRRK
jgi:hypothetical protein